MPGEIYSQNPWKILMKKFMFNKVAAFWRGTSLKMDFFVVIRGVFKTLSNIKNTNIFVGLDFKHHMELSTSGILYLECLNQNIRILKFDSVKKLQTSSSCCWCY